jgi:hypothetical protein
VTGLLRDARKTRTTGTLTQLTWDLEFPMAVAHWLFPAAVVLLQLCLKLFIDRTVVLPDVVEAFLAAPVDAAFLGLSLLAAVIIVDSRDVEMGLGMFAGGVVCTVLVIVMWRRAQLQFDNDRFGLAVLLGTANWAIAAVGVMYAIQLLREGALP